MGEIPNISESFAVEFNFVDRNLLLNNNKKESFSDIKTHMKWLDNLTMKISDSQNAEKYLDIFEWLMNRKKTTQMIMDSFSKIYN